MAQRPAEVVAVLRREPHVHLHVRRPTKNKCPCGISTPLEGPVAPEVNMMRPVSR